MDNEGAMSGMMQMIMPMLTPMITPELIANISEDVGAAITELTGYHSWLPSPQRGGTEWYTTEEMVNMVLQTIFTVLTGCGDDCPDTAEG